MGRLLLSALVLCMNANAGMGVSTQRWRQFRAHGSFLGVFRDYRGARAAFVVEEKSGVLLGPLDLDAPSGPGWAVPPGAVPDVVVGDSVEVVYAGIVRAERPFGHPPVEDLAKTRADRRPTDPAEGMFVSLEKKGPAHPIVTQDPLALALLGQLPSLDSDEARRKAAVGFLLRKDAAHFRAVHPPPELARLGALILGGLDALEGPYAPAVRLWRQGKKDEARALATDLPKFQATDRWRHPYQPMESSPGAPLMGPFLRWNEHGDADRLVLEYLVPEIFR